MGNYGKFNIENRRAPITLKIIILHNRERFCTRPSGTIPVVTLPVEGYIRKGTFFGSFKNRLFGVKFHENSDEDHYWA
jgi:hypothetical protein